MTRFVYRARTADGEARGGAREADDLLELNRRLRHDGLHLVTARVENERAPRPALIGESLSTSELLLLTFHLRTILEAGLPLLSGLHDLETESRGRRQRRILADIGEAIAGGASFAQALDRHPRAFPQVYRGMVRAGEATGRLVESLDRIHEILEWQQEVRSKIRELTTYPAIVLLAMIGLSVLALVWVIPQFQTVLQDVRGTTPLPTRVLLAMSAAVRERWPWLLAGAAALAVVWCLMRWFESTRRALDRLLLRLPLVGGLATVHAYSQVVHFLGANIDAGLGLPESLELTESTVGNREIRRVVRQVRHLVVGGESLSSAIEQTKAFPSLVHRMVATGESSGSLVETLERTKRIYDRILPAAMKTFAAAMGPVITIVMAMGVLFLMLAILLPLYKIYETLGGIGP